MTKSRFSKVLCMIVTLAVLIGAGFETHGRLDRGRINDFHEAVEHQYRTVIAPKLENLGPNDEWEGDQLPVTPEAIALLRPNFIFERRYNNGRVGFTVLMSQTRDARDMLGHYPPICYTGQGWRLTRQVEQPKDRWVVDDVSIAVMEYDFRRSYEFSVDEEEVQTYLVVRNFMILPDRNSVWDMDLVDKHQEDFRKRGYGAAQVQIVFYGETTTMGFRDDITTMLITTLEPLLKTILNGVVIE
ncbi:MAG: hypothetical protein CMJ49_00590 [Planctomycetaceae bacterium]|nr:hypothetical protein [Planctomycetaceae bacterium]